MAKLSFSFAAILGLLTAIGPLCSDFYLPALPEIATQLNTSTTLTQLSLTSALIGLGLGQLFFGPLSDRIGRKNAAAVLTFAVCTGFSALCQHAEYLRPDRLAICAGRCRGGRLRTCPLHRP